MCACEGGGGRRASAGKQEWCTAEEVDRASEESLLEEEEELAYPLAENDWREEDDTQQEFLGDKLQYPQTFWGESEEEEETTGMRDQHPCLRPDHCSLAEGLEKKSIKELREMCKAQILKKVRSSDFL
jgi:hypothetical protein